MSYFVIAGMADCDLFNHVRYAALYLSDYLPNFEVNILEFEETKWKTWLKDINLKNKWYHLSSPIIWKELTLRGGKAHLIGGASDFWEYCYDYYELESILPREELEKITADIQQLNCRKREIEDDKQKHSTNMIILLTYNCEYVLLPIVMRLLSHVKLFQTDDVLLRLLKLNGGHAKDDIENTDELSMFGIKTELVDDFEQGLDNCDLCIITGNYMQKSGEESCSWLNRNKLLMEEISKSINEYAKNSMRVIVGIHGPVCFDVAVLIENVTKIHLFNMVGVTSDVGLETLTIVSKVIDMPLKNLFAPPVWGFIGINHIIDLENIIQKYDVYRPNVRAVKNNYGSTLHLGTKHTELRYINYLSDELKSVWLKLNDKYDFKKRPLNRIAKARAIVCVVENWYDPKLAGNIICLGILSCGKFGIPAGLVFSQPVILKRKRWVPMKHYPKPRKDPAGVDDLVECTIDIYKHFDMRTDIISL